MTERAMPVDEQVSQIRREVTSAMQALRESTWVLAYEWLASADTLLFDRENGISNPQLQRAVEEKRLRYRNKKIGSVDLGKVYEEFE